MKDIFSKFNIELTDELVLEIDKYYSLLIEENKKFNLTRIVDKTEFLVKHVLDSILPFFKNSNLILPKSILDIGSGAGFPGIIIALFFPNTEVILTESIGKKARFLSFVKTELNLTNLKVINDRVENVKEVLVDLVTARAVTDLSSLVKYALPKLTKGGMMCFYKATKATEEISEFKKTKLVNLVKNINLTKFILPFEMGERVCVWIEKK